MENKNKKQTKNQKIKKDSNSLSLPNYEPLRNELSRILEIKDQQEKTREILELQRGFAYEMKSF